MRGPRSFRSAVRRTTLWPPADASQCAAMACLQALEPAPALPIGDGGPECGQLDVGVIEVVGHHLLAERVAGERARSERLARVAQRGRHALEVADVGVALARRRRL